MGLEIHIHSHSRYGNQSIKVGKQCRDRKVLASCCLSINHERVCMEDEGGGRRALRPSRERTKGPDTLYWGYHRDEVEQRDRLVSAGPENQTLDMRD